MLNRWFFGHFFCHCALWIGISNASAAEPVATREFEIRNDRPFLGGQEVRLWGIRCGNAIHSEVVTQRHIQNLDNMVAHGINLIGVYIQGSNAGWPDPNVAANGFTRDGLLKPEFAERLERIIREADKRGMVVMVGLFTPRKDQEFYDDAAIQQAIEQAARFLSTRKLKNVFIDIMHEFSHPERIDKEIFREPNGEQKKAKLTKWFKDVAPDIEVGICPDADTQTKDTYPGMDVRLIQKDMPIATTGFVVNVEMLRQDVYQNDGVFGEAGIAAVYRDCETYKAAENSAFMFHSAFVQGITNNSGTAPHAEMGGYGRKVSDRGVRFYYEWVRDNVGRYEYPRHVPVSKTP
ncbi:hypothetical protein Pan44_41150 [Caulifigura coniformis]|uniref:Glycoside hydrolase family 5 domain-containing protein n=1 Tax=Caulifigura coniformis TaxID=2527983 RepID=A0A517SIW8_9PLAN|nr:hypothetical protein [Caulifigura coniformis]QDT56065.1 hypothetical protein Pan44_41150 [Caulifigura coniformis]